MQSEAQPLEHDLLDLAAATRRVAITVDEPAISARLMQIADELTEMAGQGGRGAG